MRRRSRELLGGQGTGGVDPRRGRSTLASAGNEAPSDVVDARLSRDVYAAALASGATIRQVIDGPSGRMLVVASPIQLTPGGDGNVKGGNGNGKGPAFVPPGQAKKNTAPPTSSRSRRSPSRSRTRSPSSRCPSPRSIRRSLGFETSSLLLALAAFAAGLLATITISRRCATRPLDRVATAASRLAAGDLAARTGRHRATMRSGRSDGRSTRWPTGSKQRSGPSAPSRPMPRTNSRRRSRSSAATSTSLNLRTLPVDDEARLLISMRREIDRMSRLARGPVAARPARCRRPRRCTLAESISPMS